MADDYPPDELEARRIRNAINKAAEQVSRLGGMPDYAWVGGRLVGAKAATPEQLAALEAETKRAMDAVCRRIYEDAEAFFGKCPPLVYDGDKDPGPSR